MTRGDESDVEQARGGFCYLATTGSAGPRTSTWDHLGFTGAAALLFVLAIVLAGCAAIAPPALTCEPPLVKRMRVVAQRVPVNQGRQVLVIERRGWVEECAPPSPRE